MRGDLFVVMMDELGNHRKSDKGKAKKILATVECHVGVCSKEATHAEHEYSWQWSRRLIV